MNTHLFAAVLSAALVLGGAGLARAQALERAPGAPTNAGPVSVLVRVSSHDLDLSSEAGADMFVRRLSSAINRACNDRLPDAPPSMLARSDGFRACRATALSSATNKVRSPLVRQRIAQLHGRGETHIARR